jgi:hypothetical protein
MTEPEPDVSRETSEVAPPRPRRTRATTGAGKSPAQRRDSVPQAAEPPAPEPDTMRRYSVLRAFEHHPQDAIVELDSADPRTRGLVHQLFLREVTA